jgi:type I restriction enzyme R subunit
MTLLKELHSKLIRSNTASLLKKSVVLSDCEFTLYHPKPNHTKNIDAVKLYQSNIFSIGEEFNIGHNPITSKGQIVDVVVFINGIPLITNELKSKFSNQSILDALYQYKTERDPNNPIFKYAFANVGIDEQNVALCASLNGADSEFKSFNKDFKTELNNNGEAYFGLAKDGGVVNKETLTYLIQNFIYVDEKHNKIFPYYHQIRSIIKTVQDIENNGLHRHYLYEHSAGSGKTKSISWLIRCLHHLMNPDNNPYFDVIIFFTDRKNIESMNRDSIRQVLDQLTIGGTKFEQAKSASDLEKLIKEGKTKIIISTIQKFNLIKKLTADKSKHYALVIDEAHSSTSGESMENLVDELSGSRIVDINKNLTIFAFTATPKNETTKLFGKP